LDGCYFVGDKAYDSVKIIHIVQSKNGVAVIPSRTNRSQPRDYDKELYKLRNVVERFFNRLKQFRRIATRYEKLAASFLAILFLAASRITIPWF
jgi:transposase